MMVAAGMTPVSMRFVGSTFMLAGATPKLHFNSAPEQTCGQPISGQHSQLSPQTPRAIVLLYQFGQQFRQRFASPIDGRAKKIGYGTVRLDCRQVIGNQLQGVVRLLAIDQG